MNVNKVPHLPRFLRILGHENEIQHGSKATVYLLQLHYQEKFWIVKHRYQDFKDLYDFLTGNRFKCPALPPKKFLGTFNPEFIEKRQHELTNWLYSLSTIFEENITICEPHLIDQWTAFLMLQPIEYSDSPNKSANGSFTSASSSSSSLSTGPSSSFGLRNAISDPNEKKSIFTGMTSINTTDEDSLMSDATSNTMDCLYSTPKTNLDAFELLKVIGKGSYGKVTLVRKRDTGRLYAMKCLNKSNVKKRNQVEHTRTERSVLTRAKHPFIVHLHYAFQTSNKLYFVLDYCPGGELFFHLSRLEKFDERVAKLFAAEIVLALEHLHDLGIVYRDLKPENILFDTQGHVLLADFGLAKEGITEGAEGAYSMCGTPEYLPPEVLDRTGHGTSVDWWALGMVLYEMLTGLPPWYTRNRQKLFDRLRRAPLTFPDIVMPNARHLICSLLQRNPAERLGSKNAKEVRDHPFFAEINWQDLYDRKVTSLFNPCHQISDLEETRNFEAEFTRMQVHSVENNSLLAFGSLQGSSYTRRSMTFQGFTYNTPNDLHIITNGTSDRDDMVQ